MKLLPIIVHFSIWFRFMTETSWCTVRPSKHSWSWVCQSAVRRTGRIGAARSQQRSCEDWKDHKSSTPTEAGMKRYQTLGSSWTGGFLPKEHSALSHGLPRLLAIRVSGVVAACISLSLCVCGSPQRTGALHSSLLTLREDSPHYTSVSLDSMWIQSPANTDPWG